jgi:hypothetical protein
MAAPEEMKQREWEATGSSPVTGRGGEGEHTGRRQAVVKLIQEEKEHCTVGSDGTGENDDDEKKQKMVWIMYMHRESL